MPAGGGEGGQVAAELRQAHQRGPTGGSSRAGLGALEPPDEGVGSDLGDPSPARVAALHVPADGLGHHVVELAQAIGLQGLIAGVHSGGGGHRGLLQDLEDKPMGNLD